MKLIGYFGFSNLGDDLMLLGFLGELRRMNHREKIELLSINPVLTRSLLREYEQVSISQANWKSYLLLPFCTNRSEPIVWVGGTCLYQDKTDTLKKGLFWLTYIAVITALLGKKFILFNIGVNHVTNWTTKFLIKLIISFSAKIVVRDQQSRDNVLYYVKRKYCGVGGDLALLYNFPSKKKSESVVGILPHGDHVMTKQLNDVIEHLTQRHFKVKLIGMSDTDLTSVSCHPNKYNACKYNGFSVDKILNELGQCNFIIGQRLHSIVIASAMRIPVFSVNYDQKIRQFCCRMNIDDAVCNDFDNVMLRLNTREEPKIADEATIILEKRKVADSFEVLYGQ